MKKFWIQVAVLLIIIFGSLLYTFGNTGFGLTQTEPPQAGVSPSPGQATLVKIKLNDSLINAEVADTDDKRRLGLGGRDSLATDSGMLFVFQTPSKYQFWMKDMKIGLDFIWIRGDTVVDVLPNIPSPDPSQSEASLKIYEPVTDVDKILEVNSGFAAMHNVRVGDKIYQVQ